MRKIRFLLIWVAAFLSAVFLFGSEMCWAEDEGVAKLMKPGERIIVDGDKVEYFEEDGRIVAKGNVVVTYGDTTLTCESIEVNTKSRKALCRGKVKIVDPNGTITGERIRYDFALKKGQAFNAEIDAFPWFGEAKESARVGDNEFIFRNGYVTTCDLDIPHYRIKASEVRIFPDDKIIAKNVCFYIKDIPVLWFPYYCHPIIQSRAKVQFIPGQSTDWGYFLLSAWRQYILGESRVDGLFDYRSKKGFAEGLTAYYRTKDLSMPGWGDGFYRMYFVDQNGKGTYDPTPFRDEWPDQKKRELGKKVKTVNRRMFQWKHRVEFDPSIVGMMEFNKYSDEYFLEDYFYNEYTESSTIPQNYVSITSAQQNYFMEISANARFHKFETIVQRQPEIKFDVPEQQVGNWPLYFSSSYLMTMFDKQYSNKTSPCEIVNRFDAINKISIPINFILFKMTPYGSFQETIYSRTKKDYEMACRNTLAGGVNLSSRFFRIFDFSTNFLGLNINKIRHIVAPSITYSHTEQPNIYKSELYQMDEIDTLAKQNNVTLSLENKLQTKKLFGDNVGVVDLARLIISADYNYDLQKNKWIAVKDGPYRKHGRFSDVTFDLEVRPYDWLFVDSRMVVQRKNLAVKEGYLEGAMSPVDWFRMTMGYRYEKKEPNPRNAFTFDARWEPNKKWRFGVYERFDVQQRIIEEQQFTVTRDLHCWEVEFSYNVEGSRFFQDQYTLWLAFKIKAFPDLQIGLDRSFSRRKPGSLRPGSDVL
ncbi:MAG: LPS assembly protein LptD [Candidatus Omnitrophota bacterium]|nr:LPS assembly protein LptD [Candidatus Omnitrophota bacterium]